MPAGPRLATFPTAGHGELRSGLEPRQARLAHRALRGPALAGEESGSAHQLCPGQGGAAPVLVATRLRGNSSSGRAAGAGRDFLGVVPTPIAGHFQSRLFFLCAPLRGNPKRHRAMAFGCLRASARAAFLDPGGGVTASSRSGRWRISGASPLSTATGRALRAAAQALVVFDAHALLKAECLRQSVSGAGSLTTSSRTCARSAWTKRSGIRGHEAPRLLSRSVCAGSGPGDALSRLSRPCWIGAPSSHARSASAARRIRTASRVVRVEALAVRRRLRPRSFMEVIEHTRSPAASLDETCRVLGRGGRPDHADYP